MTDSETKTEAKTSNPQPRKPNKTVTFWKGRGDTIAHRAYAGMRVTKGQIIELKGVKNDQKLIDLEYIEEMTVSPQDIAKCSKCGAEFIDSNFLEDHYDTEADGEDTEVEVSEPVAIGA